MSTHKPESALIVAEEPLMRLGLKQFLHQEMHLHACVEAATAAQALRLQMQHLPTLVVVFFCDQSQTEAVRLVRELRRQRRQQAVLVVARVMDRAHVQACISAGVLGYVLGSDGLVELRLACLSVLRGDLHITQVAAKALQGSHRVGAEQRERLRELSLRERQVLDLMGKGVKGVDLAARLGICVKTVETHQKHLKEKLELPNITELWLLAAQIAAKPE